MTATSSSPALVGRAAECDALAGVLAALPARPGRIVALTGEPGIGKSRLLAHLAQSAEAEGFTVLRARASEYEADLPYALFTEALAEQLGERELQRLGVADRAALASVLPAPGTHAAAQPDRHRAHRALRDLLERLAASGPVVACLDDVHWADPASVDALAALARRPPAAPVLLALAAREGQMPASLATALGGALAEGRVTALALAPLTEHEASELVGEAAVAIYAKAGGNPFYLEQLARVRDARSAEAGPEADGAVPVAVAAALSTELAGLSPAARVLLDAAAVTGDPFEPGLAAAVAELDEPRP